MSRRYATDYAGARGRLDLRDLSALPGSSWQVQPKIDGMFVHLHTNDDGRIWRVTSRTGRVVDERIHRLTGERVGARWSVLCGELEAHTEAGRLAAESRPGGLPRVHLFDALEVCARSLRGEPYRARRYALCEMHYGLQDGDDGNAFAVDRMGQAYDRRNGRWCPRLESGWRRAPVVPQAPVSEAERLWDEYVSPGGEGLVVVAMDAPAGARQAKLKIKPRDTLDCVVVDADSKRAVLRSFGREFAVGCGNRTLRPGQVWSVAHEGYYADGTPRFARLSAPRVDL